MPTAPRNTATPDGMFEVALQAFGGSPEGVNPILKQEADGQRSFTTSDTLPTQMGREDRKVLEQAGVVFNGKVSGDEMFTYVTLPAGWQKVATSHSMWSDLVDDKGRKRAEIFYKAAFYDRDAYLRINRRFGIRKDYDYEKSNNATKVDVIDVDRIVFSSQPHPFTEKFQQEWNAAQEAASDEAKAWLEKNYPNWEDASAYWD